MREYVSREQAKQEGLPKYYDGRRCKAKKHDCERYTSNGSCVDCQTSASRGTYTTASADREMTRGKIARPVTERVLLSGEEQAKVLDAFAKAGNYDHAAAAIGITTVQLRARRTANEGFDTAFRRLEDKFGTRDNGAVSTPDFEWTAEKHATLIDRFVDSGDIAEARDAIGVSPSEYQRELDRNSDFAQAVKEAEPKAHKHLEERAIQMALRGNDKLLTAVLKAKNPEYRDSLKLDINSTVRNISNDELDRRLTRLGRGQIIDARFVEVKSLPEAGASPIAGGEAEASGAQQDWDDLS
jgi:hypothetical protein